MSNTHSLPQMVDLRLLVVGVSWRPETFLTRLLYGLASAGAQVTIACVRKPDRQHISHPRFRWLRTPAWNGAIVARLFRLARMAASTLIHGQKDVRVMAAHTRHLHNRTERLEAWNRLLPFAGRRWDVVYFPWNSAAISHLPLFELGSPVVVSCRGSQVNLAPHNPKRVAIREGLRRTFQRAAAVHCVSEAIKQEALQYGLDPGKAWVIRPAVDPHFFRPGQGPSEDHRGLRVVTAGSFIWTKGHEYALLAIRRLVDSHVAVRFDIVGDGPERQRLLYAIHDLDLEHFVHLDGELTPEGVRERLQKADVFLLSSLSEGISNAVLEAMACSLPVVTTGCGGMREVVMHGVQGFVVPVRNPEAMAQALGTLCKSPMLRRRMGQAGRKRILQEFTLDHQVEKFLGLCQTVVRNASG